MLRVAILGGKSGASIAKEVKKWNVETAIIAGKQNEIDETVSDYICLTDLKNKEEIFRFLCNLDIEYLIVGTGHILAIELCEYLISKGIKINLNIELVKLYKNKYTTKEILHENNIRVPKQQLLSTKNLKQYTNIFPCVVKSLSDKFAPILIKSIEELNKILVETKEEEIMLEEYIEGNDLTVMVSNIENHIEVFPIYWSKGRDDKLKGFQNSYSIPLGKEVEKELIENAKLTTKILDLDGVFRIDYIVKNEKIYFLEVNSVFVSDLNGSKYAYQFYKKGIDRAKYIVNYAFNKFNLIDKIVRKDSILYIDDIKEYDCDSYRSFFEDSVIDEIVTTYASKMDKKSIDKLLFYIMEIVKSGCDRIISKRNDDSFILQIASDLLMRDIYFK